MSESFADTFFYIALANVRDAAHERTRNLAERFTGRYVTTRWVLAEVADALSRPADRRKYIQLLDAMERDVASIILPVSDEQFHRGVALFAARSDKSWSLTDCISFAVMQERGIVDALTGDRHFQQAGFRALLAED